MLGKIIVTICLILFGNLLYYPQQVHAQTSCVNNPTSTTTATSQVTISQTGTYTVWSQILAPTTTNDSYFLKVDGGCAIDVGDGSAIQANTWTWVNYQNGNTASPLTMSLSAGTHTVELIQNANGVGVGRILFDSDSSCIPTGTGDNCASQTAIAPTPTPSPTIIPTPTQTVIANPTTVPTSTPAQAPTTALVTPTPTPQPQLYTVGYTSFNGMYVSGRNNQISLTQATTGPGGGALQSISVYVGKVAKSPGNHMQVSIYTDNGSNAPGMRLISSGKIGLKANSWNKISLSGVTINPNTRYWLGFNLDGLTTQVGLYSSSTGVSTTKSVKFGTWPNTWGTMTSTLTQQYSIYMIY